ncbi:hypothetical protein Patl1_15775 [Pistacia atlantica]|uniref:Uncharacterized protein n=1 Tax=Pistacia atlantica TaxID=434234 RepID=A0ACC1B6M1_9ROSI|nr:hypothetical protein Patl1_15775 [Pistacia atlantica]
MPSTNITIEKASAPTTLSASAVNTGGHDATTLRTLGPRSSSALDLIKKKLQDSGTPVTSLAAPVTSGIVASKLNSSKAIEDEDSGPSKEECITKFKEMLKERGVAPFSKWEKELPKNVFDPRFKSMYILLDGNISHSYCDEFAALLIGKGIFGCRPSQVNRSGGPCLNLC